MNYRIALVHGFFRNYKDMEELENNLMGMGYTVDNLNFPLTFPKIDISIEILKKYLLNLKFEGLNQKDEIVLIGFGFGGVLIKEALKEPDVKGIVDKVILLSSPINDSTLHRRTKRVFPFLDLIFKPLAAYSRIRKDKRNFDENIEVGLIIGRESYGFFGKWLGEFNDGYVELKDVDIADAKDKLLIPITHDELNKKIGTARYIHNFITKGKFRLE